MLTLVSLIGVIAAFIFILNLLSIGHKNEEAVRSDAKNKIRPNVKKTLQKNMSEGRQHLRMCPVCGKLLEKKDYLIAAMDPVERTGQKRQAHIYGCPYCFLSEGVNTETSEFVKLQP